MSDAVKMFVGYGLRNATQEGRYYVAVTLQEAEAIRSVIHIRSAASEAEGALSANSQCMVALHANKSILAASPNFQAPSDRYQYTMADQCMRFINNQMDYSQNEVYMLLRAVQVLGMSMLLCRQIPCMNVVGRFLDSLGAILERL